MIVQFSRSWLCLVRGCSYSSLCNGASFWLLQNARMSCWIDVGNASMNVPFMACSLYTRSTRRVFIESASANCESIVLGGWVIRSALLSASVIALLVAYVSTRWFTTLLYVANTPSFFLFQDYFSFRRSLAVSAAGSVHFVKHRMIRKALPSWMALLSHAILNPDKKPLTDTGTMGRNVGLLSVLVVCWSTSKHVSHLLHRRLETFQPKVTCWSPALSCVGHLQV